MDDFGGKTTLFSNIERMTNLQRLKEFYANRPPHRLTDTSSISRQNDSLDSKTSNGHICRDDISGNVESDRDNSSQEGDTNLQLHLNSNSGSNLNSKLNPNRNFNLYANHNRNSTLNRNLIFRVNLNSIWFGSRPGDRYKILSPLPIFKRFMNGQRSHLIPKGEKDLTSLKDIQTSRWRRMKMARSDEEEAGNINVMDFEDSI